MQRICGKTFGYSNALFKRHALFYIGIQITIWIKVAIFFTLFGKGIIASAPFLPPAFFTAFVYAFSMGPIFTFDWVFHTLMHILIAFVSYTFATRATKLPSLPLLRLGIAGSILHNVGYWLTGVFQGNYMLMLVDFLSDIMFLMLFIHIFHFISKFIKLPMIPLLEK